MVTDNMRKPEASCETTVSFVEKMYKSAFSRALLSLLIRPNVSRLIGRYLDSSVSRLHISPFIRRNAIDLSQCEKTHFSSFNDFFTRRLKEGARPVDRDPAALIAPCDGLLSVFEIDRDSILEIKGQHYTVSELAGELLGQGYNNGLCLIYRLTPSDYHRYVYFDDCYAHRPRTIPGVLHTVRPLALSRERVFARNARSVTLLRTENFKDALQIEVGALLVGRICNEQAERRFRRGDEKGRFEFGGSTIVILLENDAARIAPEILSRSKAGLETRVRLGERVGVAANEEAGIYNV